MTLTYSSIFTFLNAYCSLFPVFLKPPVGGEPGEVPSIAACSFNLACNQQMSANDDKQYTETKTIAMFIHNLACNQQMSVNDDKQYTETKTTAMFIHNLACKQTTPR